MNESRSMQFYMYVLVGGVGALLAFDFCDFSVSVLDFDKTLITQGLGARKSCQLSRAQRGLSLG